MHPPLPSGGCIFASIIWRVIFGICWAVVWIWTAAAPEDCVCYDMFQSGIWVLEMNLRSEHGYKIGRFGVWTHLGETPSCKRELSISNTPLRFGRSLCHSI